MPEIGDGARGGRWGEVDALCCVDFPLPNFLYVHVRKIFSKIWAASPLYIHFGHWTLDIGHWTLDLIIVKGVFIMPGTRGCPGKWPGRSQEADLQDLALIHHRTCRR